MEKILSRIFNKQANKIEKEKEEVKLNLFIFDDSQDQDYANLLDFHFNEDDNFPTKAKAENSFDQIIDKAEKGETDIVFITPDCNINEELLRGIVKLRNDIKVKKQPIIFIMTSEEKRSEVEKIQKYATDIVELPPYIDVEKLSGQFNSVPELLGYIEDEYGEKMAKNKIAFYDEYKKLLMGRSDHTADTEKELEILEEVFEKNGSKKILDAGGGEGRIAIPLSKDGYEITNLDSSEELIIKMKEKESSVNGVVGDLKQMPVDSESQDAITFNWHIFSDILGKKAKKKTLEEAYRVLKVGGVIVLDIPDREGGSYEKDGVYVQNPGGENIFIGYTPGEDEMKKYLKEANFRNIEIKKWATKTGFRKITFVGEKFI